MGAVGQHQSAQAQANYQNEVQARNYEHAVRQQKYDWQNQLGIWAQKRLEYQQSVNENFSAADRAYASEQSRMNEMYDQALFQKQGMMQQLLGLQGTNAASERSGRSVQRLDTAAVGAFGRNNAVIAANLSSADAAMRGRLYDTSQQLDAANMRAYNQVIIPPQTPFGIQRPTPVPGPSGSSLGLGLAGAALSGFGTYASMKAPSAGNMNPNPPNVWQHSTAGIPSYSAGVAPFSGFKAPVTNWGSLSLSGFNSFGYP